MYRNRDVGINLIKAREGHCCYGMGLGIIIMDDIYPGFPGDVRNASAYPFPIQYEIAEGVDIDTLVYQEDKSPCLEPVIRAAKKLERMGCRAIAAECGYFALFQPMIAVEVGVPVFMSSLLQAPWAQQLIGPNKVVGILISDARVMTQAHLEAVGIRTDLNYVLGGVEDGGGAAEFANLWDASIRPDPPQAYFDKAKAQLLAAATDFYHAHPSMGAMVLECTGYPPFARALQREIDIPIFSWGTLLDYAYSVAVHRDYYGYV